MSQPKTLLQMAGADLSPPKLDASALVIIDAQREYVDGKLPLPHVAPALDNIAALLQKARAAGAPVIHIAHRGNPGGAFDGAGFAFAPQAANRPGETVIEKKLPNAFAGTTLAEELRKTGRKTVVFAGFMTHMCISSSARAALDLGFRASVVADASATRALPDPVGGEPIAADVLHRIALAELADRFAVVCRTADVVR